MSNRRLVAVVAVVVVFGMVIAIALQTVPILSGSGSDDASSQRLTGQAHPAKDTPFVRDWRQMVSAYAAQTVQLEQAGRAQAGNTGALIDVYRELEHSTLAVIDRARALKADTAAAASYQSFISALEAQDRDLRAVIAAGESNATEALQRAVQALTRDIALLAMARAAVENALAH